MTLSLATSCQQLFLYSLSSLQHHVYTLLSRDYDEQRAFIVV